MIIDNDDDDNNDDDGDDFNHNDDGPTNDVGDKEGKPADDEDAHHRSQGLGSFRLF